MFLKRQDGYLVNLDKMYMISHEIEGVQHTVYGRLFEGGIRYVTLFEGTNKQCKEYMEELEDKLRRTPND